MKKLLLSILLIPAIAATVQAQKLYVRAAIGYAFPAAGQSLSTDGLPYSGNALYTSNTSGNQQLSYFESDRVSYNTGIQAQVAFGHMFTNNIGVDLGLTAGLTHTIHEVILQYPSGGYRATESYKTYAQTPLILSPSLVLQSGGKTINVYTRAGIALPMHAAITNEITGTLTVPQNNAVANTVNVTEELKTRFGLGFTGAAGVKYRVGAHTHLMLELSGIALSVYADKAEWTEYILDGRIVPLSIIDEAARIKRYSKESSGTNLPTYALPFSNVSVNAGITVDLY